MRQILNALFCGAMIIGVQSGAAARKAEPDTTVAPQTHHSFKSFDSHTVHYLDEGQGPVVLLLHGLTMNADNNFRQSGIVKALVEAGYRVIAPDLRGHGKSSIANTAKNWPADAMARDQIALMQHLGCDPEAIVGYSMGSIVALRLHLLSRLGDKLILAGMGHTVALENDAERYNLVVSWLNDAKNGAETDTACFIRMLIMQSGSTPDSVAGTHRTRMSVPPDLLRTFDLPVLVLNGDADFDNGSGVQLAELLPQGEFHSVEGNHMSAIGNPEFAQAMVAFLGK